MGISFAVQCNVTLFTQSTNVGIDDEITFINYSVLSCAALSDLCSLLSVFCFYLQIETRFFLLFRVQIFNDSSLKKKAVIWIKTVIQPKKFNIHRLD